MWQASWRTSYLHSTMYLLNLIFAAYIIHKTEWFTFHYVSIKSGDALGMATGAIRFTFHYVSIKSAGALSKLGSVANLHSTMYLLNPKLATSEQDLTKIYIPLCIY